MIIKYKTKLLVLLLTVFQVACSKNDSEGAKSAPVFPQKSEISAVSNDTLFLNFSANKKWRLESNKLWTKFLKNITENKGDNTITTEELSIITGEAGSQDIKVVIKPDGERFDESHTAELKLYMEGGEQVIYNITRSPKERLLDVMLYTTTSPFTYEKVDKIIIDTMANGSIRIRRFGVMANYDWKIIECPQWIDQPLRNITGTSGTPVTTSIDNSLLINGKNQAFSNTGDMIIAPKADLQNPQKWVKVPIEFKGMSPVQVGINGISRATGVVFSPEGYNTESQPSSGVGITPTEEREVLFDFWTRDMEYKLSVVKYNPVSKKVEILDKNSEECWLKIALDQQNIGNVRLSVKSSDIDNHSGIDKELYLFILPKKYSQIEYNYNADFTNGIPKKTGFQYKVIKQTDVGFKIVNSITQEVLWATKVIDPSLSSRFGTDEIYKFGITKAFWNVKRASITFTGNLWGGAMYSRIPDNIWAKSIEGKDGGFSMSNLIPYDSLPDEDLMIEFKSKDGSTNDRVLILSKN